MIYDLKNPDKRLQLASFKEEQPPYGSNAASHVGAAFFAHVARSGRSDAALRRKELIFEVDNFGCIPVLTIPLLAFKCRKAFGVCIWCALASRISRQPICERSNWEAFVGCLQASRAFIFALASLSTTTLLCTARKTCALSILWGDFTKKNSAKHTG